MHAVDLTVPVGLCLIHRVHLLPQPTVEAVEQRSMPLSSVPAVIVRVWARVPLNKNWGGSLQRLFPQQLQACQPLLCLSHIINCKMRRWADKNSLW